MSEERQCYTSLCGKPIAPRVGPLTDVRNIQRQIVLGHIYEQIEGCVKALHKEVNSGPADAALSPLWMALLTAEAEIKKLTEKG